MEAFATFCPTTKEKSKIFKEDLEEYEEVKTFDVTSCQKYNDDNKPIDDRILDEMESLRFESGRFECQEVGRIWFCPSSLEEVLGIIKKFPKGKLRMGGTGGLKKCQHDKSWEPVWL